MSELSDYKRMVSEPYEARLIADNASLLARALAAEAKFARAEPLLSRSLAYGQAWLAYEREPTVAHEAACETAESFLRGEAEDFARAAQENK